MNSDESVIIAWTLGKRRKRKKAITPLWILMLMFPAKRPEPWGMPLGCWLPIGIPPKPGPACQGRSLQETSWHAGEEIRVEQGRIRVKLPHLDHQRSGPRRRHKNGRPGIHHSLWLHNEVSWFLVPVKLNRETGYESLRRTHWCLTHT